ncbi:MAG: methyltransferase domain-containing protein [Rhodospirillaceae bacterium]|nr:methyltransferase domain-containing protein [Rhodospirillaceae bacterium]
MMHLRFNPRSAVRLILAISLAAVLATAQDAYTTKPPSSDGIGKVYMGREIAQVMGHLGASWLERGERAQEEGTELLVKNLPLKPTDAAADIGAGTGYFSFRLAAKVPSGKVYAVDIQQEMLDIIEGRKRTGQVSNVITVLGTESDPKLPENALDLILMVDAYHEFNYPREMGEAMVRALKPGGRIALVEYRSEDDAVPIKRLHKMTEAQAKKEMAALGLTWVETKAELPWQHLMFFQKPSGAAH